MFDKVLMIIGLTVTFCAVSTMVFFIVGLSMNYAWRKYQDAVGFAKLSRCYRMISRVERRKKNRSMRGES